jgi:hypothetical protein
VHVQVQLRLPGGAMQLLAADYSSKGHNSKAGCSKPVQQEVRGKAQNRQLGLKLM